MADSIPSLRRKLNEAMDRIRELESAPERVVERVVEVKVEGPERVVEKLVTKTVEVEVKVPMYPESVRIIDRFITEYSDNPDHIEAISKLQDRVWQLTSQLDSLLNQDQDELSLLNVQE